MAVSKAVPKVVANNVVGSRWKITIAKNNGKWTVEKPNGKVNKWKDTVEWTLERGNPPEPVTAHFQFTQGDFFENLPGRADLTPDWTADILANTATLELKINEAADTGRNPRFYAVWIQYECPKGGGAYAVGEEGNPPPEMDVGP
jgi:hypothetical protein